MAVRRGDHVRELVRRAVALASGLDGERRGGFAALQGRVVGQRGEGDEGGEVPGKVGGLGRGDEERVDGAWGGEGGGEGVEGLVGDGPGGEGRAGEVWSGGVGEEGVVEREVVDVG